MSFEFPLSTHCILLYTLHTCNMDVACEKYYTIVTRTQKVQKMRSCKCSVTDASKSVKCTIYCTIKYIGKK